MPVETLLVVAAIAAVFLLFMGVVMWCDAHSQSEHQQPDNPPQP